MILLKRIMLVEAVRILLAIVAIAIAIILLSGCASSRAAEKAAAEAEYTAQHLACVDKSKTFEESEACRAAVRLKWGITETRAKDGGQ